jgi:hypothetical protein
MNNPWLLQQLTKDRERDVAQAGLSRRVANPDDFSARSATDVSLLMRGLHRMMRHRRAETDSRGQRQEERRPVVRSLSVQRNLGNTGEARRAQLTQR